MALVTRCPGCNSIFSLTITELQAHDGKVQCGQCTQLFNAFATLMVVPELSLLEQSPSAAEASEAAQVSESRKISRNELEAPAFDIQDPAKNLSYAVDLPDAQSLHKTSRKWLFASLFMLLILAGQSIYFYRTELAIAAPGFKPFLAKYCMLLQCTVGLPQHIALLSLESSDLRANPAPQTEVVTLIATIRNHAPFPQELPALLLTLTDINDRPLASRILTAHDYFDQESDSRVFAANSEIDIKLYFDNSALNATGYRLLLHYP